MADVELRSAVADSPESLRLRAAYEAELVSLGGLARRLLATLEAAAVELGATSARLDTGRDMAPAIALYRASGYDDIDDYNGNPDAGWWFEKTL